MTRLILLAPLVLAACDTGPTVTATNASGAEVAAKVKAANLDTPFVSPGRWEGTMTIGDIRMPDLPPEAAAQMKATLGKPKTFIRCLTAEQAKAPKEEFFGGDRNCRFAHYTMGNGRIDADMTCKEDGMTRTMKMSGTYAPDSYAMKMVSAGSAASGGPMAQMSMTVSVTGRRTGVCTGKENG